MFSTLAGKGLNVIQLNPKADVAASSETLEYTCYTETYHSMEGNNINTGKVRHLYFK
jgi:hypothetical protein